MVELFLEKLGIGKRGVGVLGTGCPQRDMQTHIHRVGIAASRDQGKPRITSHHEGVETCLAHLRHHRQSQYSRVARSPDQIDEFRHRTAHKKLGLRHLQAAFALPQLHAQHMRDAGCQLQPVLDFVVGAFHRLLAPQNLASIAVGGRIAEREPLQGISGELYRHSEALGLVLELRHLAGRSELGDRGRGGSHLQGESPPVFRAGLGNEAIVQKVVARRERGHLQGKRRFLAGGQFLLGQFHPVASEAADHTLHRQLLGDVEFSNRDFGGLAAISDLRAPRVSGGGHNLGSLRGGRRQNGLSHGGEILVVVNLLLQRIRHVGSKRVPADIHITIALSLRVHPNNLPLAEVPHLHKCAILRRERGLVRGQRGHRHAGQDLIELVFAQLRKQAGFCRRRHAGKLLIHPGSRIAGLELLRELGSAELGTGLKEDQTGPGSHLLEDTSLGPWREGAELGGVPENNDIPLFLIQKPVEIFQLLGLQGPGDRGDIHAAIAQDIHSHWPLIQNRIEGEIEPLLEFRHLTRPGASRHQKENLRRTHIVGGERLAWRHKPLRADIREEPAVHTIRCLESTGCES